MLLIYCFLSYKPWIYFLFKNKHSCSKVFSKISVLKNFAKSPGKHLWESLFFNKVAGLRPWQKYFPVNFAKFLRTPFLQNTSGRLLLNKPLTIHFDKILINNNFFWKESSYSFSLIECISLGWSAGRIF